MEQNPEYYDDSRIEEWKGEEGAVNRKARIHAFDIEAGVFAGIVGARVGFSPGEFVDFLLGWFGVDIAGDDEARRFIPIREDPPEDRPDLALLIRGMYRPGDEQASLEAIVSLGDAAVPGLVTILTHPHSNPAPRAAAKKALEELLEKGEISEDWRKRARNVLGREDD